MKKRIRREILGLRKNLDEKEWNEKSLIIQKKFLSLPSYKKAESILTYVHFDREVRTDLIIKDALSNGKVLCIPKNNWKEENFIPSQIFSFDEISLNCKIPEPKVIRPFPPSEIEIVVVPGVAFDIFGNRIGMGKGFFDKFLKDLPPSTLKIALAFEFQVREEKLEMDLWDVKVDMIITEKREIEVGNF
ncbi:MAG: 5-formyltetrahydrofolate cyclo-ligase [Candidatus Omnitrophota bacterium]|nr:MAG: 5-formyltetrahydrofolate cyclo-ligase [Candidatus Omnitrophota bacterium]HDN97881.1 5-formyltetrahydrofolate cyclo-ligase [bacterium]